MKYYLIVGEASGDLHASNLMRALQQHDAEATFRFYGGDKMAAVGGTLVRHYKEMAYMGFIPVLLHARTILRNMRQCQQDIVDWQPDVVILVDYAGFNLRIAKFLRRHTSIPIYNYIVPKIWAWKEHRIKQIRANIDELFSILPFEVAYFEQKHHCPVHYVGNPCVDAISTFQAAAENGPKTTAATPTIAILAGSRRQEIKDNLRIMIQAAARFTDYKMVLAAAPNIDIEYYKKHIPQHTDIEIVYGKTYDILSQADAALVTSGTATLETAIIGVPQVVCYYISMGKLFRWLKRHFLKVKWISLVNLVVNREVVSELIGDEMCTDNVAAELQQILPGGARRQAMLDGYDEMRRILGPAGASERAASLMTTLLKAHYDTH